MREYREHQAVDSEDVFVSWLWLKRKLRSVRSGSVEFWEGYNMAISDIRAEIQSKILKEAGDQ